MNFLSKLPKFLLVASLSTLAFGLTDYVITNSYTSQLSGVPSRSELIVFLFMTCLCGIIAAIIAGAAMRKTQKNAWAVAALTGIGMLAVFPVLNILVGPILGYVALLPITWGLLAGASRVFSNNKHVIITFCLLFVLGIILLVAGRRFATWIFDMRSAAYYSSRQF